MSPYSVRIRENTDQKKLRIGTLFTQWLRMLLPFFRSQQFHYTFKFYSIYLNSIYYQTKFKQSD